MEYYLLRKIDIDNLLSRQHPEALQIIRDNRIIEPVAESPNLNFQLIPGDHRNLMALPQCSLLFGSVNEPWFIDTGCSVDEGALYIGKSDFVSMCNLAGFVETEHLRVAQDRIAELEQQNSELSGLLNRVRLVSRDLKLRNTSAAASEPSSGDADGSESTAA